ncbi:MAG: site-specific integrase, partial [Gammaproteobacteria bacterium]|nr:site-specific integrase [Gammaproteobacteria bacterium]
RVCGWAIDSGHREAANPAIGPNRQIRVPARKHAAFLPVEEVAGALDRIEASGCSLSVSLAIRFLALTAKRLVEVRRATWDQMDLAAAEWTSPGDARTKIAEDHGGPLSAAALGVLERAHGLGDVRGPVFPGESARVLSDSSVRDAMRRVGIDASPHGFRSTFRTWAQSRGENWEASEVSLGHRVGSSVSSSYARSDMLALRRALLERYADAALGVG